MAKSKMVVVWGNENLLGSSIEYFLSAKEDWKVVSISTKTELDALIQEMEAIQLYVVIIHQGCQNESENSPLRLLQDHPAIRVITIGFDNNALEVYSKQKIMVKQASDLISLIDNAPSSAERSAGL